MAGGVSNVLRQVQYDRQRLELTVTFKSGAVYIYAAVLPEVFRALMTAESQGVYFSQQIRGNYPYRLVQETDARRFAANGISPDE